MSLNISSSTSYSTTKKNFNKKDNNSGNYNGGNYKLEQSLKNLQKKIHSPKVDLVERDNFYLVRIELPGAKVDSINIEINDSQFLLISGSKTTNNIYETDRVVYKESKYDKFMRKVKLPGKVKPFDFKTNDLDFVNGVLNLSFEKELSQQEMSSEQKNSPQPPISFENFNSNANWADIN